MSNRELDAEVAEKVMKVSPRITWEVFNADETGIVIGFDSKIEAERWLGEHVSLQGSHHVGSLKHWPAYSTDIGDAMKVIDKMRNRFSNVSMHGANGWDVGFWDIDEEGKESGYVQGCALDSLPEAICLAALSVIQAAASASALAQQDTEESSLQPVEN